jgi:RecA/RadA recombinase
VWFGSVPVESLARTETGITAVDAPLGGGLPRGGLSEIAGAPSSGRTALMHAALAAATRRGEVVALVDLPDALHPPSLGDAGADLGRVLWVRPPSLQISLKCTDLLLAAGGFAIVALDLSGAATQRLPLHVWPRLARRAKQSRTALLVLVHHHAAGSFAAVSLSLTNQGTRWTPPPWRLFDGLTTQIRTEGRGLFRTEGRGLRTERFGR